MPMHLLIIHFFLFICSRVHKIFSGRFLFSFSIRSSYFEVVISIKPFNSTSAIPPFNLIQRSFLLVGPNPQVLSHDLTCLYELSGAILKFISKFDVRMNFHQSHAFSKVIFKFFSSLAQPFLF